MCNGSGGTNGDVQIATGGGAGKMALFTGSGTAELYYQDSKKFETTNHGAIVTGILTATSFVGDGSALTNLPASGITTSQSNTQVTYNVGASGNNYVITGNGYSNSDNNPDLYLVRGQRYRFINATGASHPFRIQSDTSGTAYTDGVSGSQSGTQEFNVQHDAPSRLFYQCTIHSGMIGNIYITGGGQWENTSVAASGTPEIYTDYNVGIGTDNPLNGLDVNQSEGRLRVNRFSHLLMQNKNDSTTDYWGISARNGGELDIGYGTPDGNSLIGGDKLTITSGGNIAYGNQSTSTANNSSALVHISAGKEYWSGTAGDYRALKHRIYDNNVDDVYGMGVSAGLLEIQAQKDIGFFAGSAGSGTGRTERLRIDSSGNLTAVNTSSGGAVTLKVGANATSGVNNGTIIINNGGTGDAALQFDYENSAARAKIYVYRSTQDLIFDTAGSERLRINSAGNIGIGTITPNTGNPSGAKYLHIHNSDGSTNSNSPSEIYFTNANTGPSGGAGGLITFYNRGFYFWNYQNDDLHFGTGGNERFKFDHSANTLDFISTSKIRLKGSNASGTTHAHLNIGSDGAANSETRAIDIWGNWQDQESKSITYNHGSGANDMVCQQRVRYNSSPSSTYYEIGRFYHGQNTTAFPIKFISKSTTNANLELTGYIKASDQGVFQGVNSNDHELSELCSKWQ